MSDTFTEEQLRNWAENVSEPTVRDLAQALLAKTAECESLRDAVTSAEGRTADWKRDSYVKEKLLNTLVEERDRLKRSTDAHVAELTRERQRAEAAEQNYAIMRENARLSATDNIRLEAQLAKVPHLQPLGDLRHAYLVGNHAPGEERIEIVCARLGGRCAALAAEKEHRADPEAGTE